MKLSKKVFLYTGATTFLVGLVIIGYFIFMLPGLYVDYKNDKYIEQISEVQKSLVAGEDENLGELITDNIYLMSVQLPESGYEFKLLNQYFSSTVEVIRPELKELIDSMRKSFVQMSSSNEDSKDIDIEFDTKQWEDLSKEFQFNQMVTIKEFKNNIQMLDDSAVISDFKQLEDGSKMMISQIESNKTQFTNIIAFKQKNGVYYITFASTMTPQLSELMPIILISTPMIVLVLLLFSLISASLFSRKLAEPVETLAKQARNRSGQKDFVFKQQNQGDEFKVLEDALNDMHQDIQQKLTQLQLQNEALEAEKEKQKIFMMNASHQLKTPIAGASLLVEGMKHKVGKFADTDVYLPKVEQELIRLSSIIENVIASFAYKSQTLDLEEISLNDLVENCLNQFSERIKDKHIQIETALDSVKLTTDPELFYSILENIINNAIQYTPQGGKMSLMLTQDKLVLRNFGKTIDEELLPRIKEAFVRSQDNQERGTGLGLYLVDTFIDMLGLRWTIDNFEEGMIDLQESGVQVVIYLKEEDSYDNH